MRILAISYEYPPLGGGGAPVCQGICESLAAAGHTVDVVTSAKPPLAREEHHNGVAIYRTFCVRRHWHFTTVSELLTGILPAYRKAMQLARKNKYDLIHCHFVVPSGLVAYLVAKRTGLPYIITAHGSDIPSYNPDRFGRWHRLIRPFWLRIIENSQAITTPSQFLKELIHSQTPVPVQVIPNGFDPPELPRLERRNRILAASRMFERKGVQYLVQALAHIDTDWEIYIVGDGPYLPEIKKLAAELGVSAHFTGQVPRDELARLYATAKIFVFASTRENFPMVLLEAMAAGCAIITTHGSGCEEVVDNAAIRIEQSNPQALRRALTYLLDDEHEIRRFQKLALDRSARFRWANIANDFIALFTRCIHADDHLTQAAGGASRRQT